MNTPLTHLIHYQATNQGYNAIAHCYEQGRVDYPNDIIQQLLTIAEYDLNMTICDLAAGTGKLTKALLNQHPQAHIIAVEPSEKMCIEFAKQLPHITIHQADAEHIPLADESMDIVVIGTAFHWFAHKKALAEITRILKPGGKLVLIWNVFDTHVSWVKEIRSLLDVYRDDREVMCNHDSLQWKTVFETTNLFIPLQHISFSYAFDGSLEEVISRIRASKIFGTLTFEEQLNIITAAEQILHQHNLSQPHIKIPYRIELYWTQRQ